MTGSAIIIGHGPGVGDATARAFGALGMKVALISRNADKVRAAAAAMTASGLSAEGFAADAGDEASLLAGLDAARSAFGTPLVVVYNAAIWRPGPVIATAPEDLVSDFRICVVGALVAARWAVPSMQENGGSLLFTGGGFAMYPSPQAPTLSIGKGAIRALALMLAEELKPGKVRVGTVTIAGTVGSAGLSAERVAQAFVDLHQAPKIGAIIEAILTPH